MNVLKQRLEIWRGENLQCWMFGVPCSKLFEPKITLNKEH
jgi:hypothetical protein